MIVNLLKAIEIIIPQSETQIHRMIKSTRDSLPYTAPGLDAEKYYDLVGEIMQRIDKQNPPYRALLVNVLRGKIDVQLILEEAKEVPEEKKTV
jgi:hypothetical protein